MEACAACAATHGPAGMLTRTDLLVPSQEVFLESLLMCADVLFAADAYCCC
jgi:hypothetical protein